MAGPDIFLSYNREDADVAKLFADAFASEGMEVWWDVTLRSGETYDEVTEAALRGAKAVVVLWSPRSVASHWVRSEATIAHRAKTLVPATIEPCDKPVMFELTQTADLCHWRGEAGDKAWLTFLGDVRRMVGKEAPEPSMKPAPSVRPAGSGIPKVAVLPITCRGGDEELEFRAEDLTEEITRELADYTHFKVIASGRLAAWRGKLIDYDAISQQLDASYLVEGKLQQTGENVRLSLQIIDAETGCVALSKRFARKADEIDVSPEDFAAAVTPVVGENIVQLEVKRALAKPGPWSGWDHLMRSAAYLARLGSGSARRWIEEARQAVAVAPDLGMAHAYLASGLAVEVILGNVEFDDELGHEIRNLITRAMELDGNNPAVISMAGAPYAVLGDIESALRLARRAVELNPGSPASRLTLGFAYMVAGRTADAIAALEERDRLSTHGAGANAALIFLGAGRLLEGSPAEAEEELDRSLALHPDMPTALKWKAVVAAMQGKEETALATIRRLREVEPDKTIDQHVRNMMFYKGLGDRLNEPVATLRRLWEASEGATKAN